MAWAQRSEATASPYADRTLDEISFLDAAQRCAGCNRLFTGTGVIARRKRYCSVECVLEARRTVEVPGNYLG
jgi:hypothetical protein